jgi:CheY-like chemotaxis protein
MGEKPRILIVEDEHIIQLDLKERLEQFGYEVVGLAGSGAEAVEMARHTRPNVVLMDVRLEGEMDGVEAALQIRLQQDMPIVYLTALADIRNLGRASGTEPYFYLLKPVRSRELRAMVENAMQRKSRIPGQTSAV